MKIHAWAHMRPPLCSLIYRDIIRQCTNCGKDDVVIFTGSGATAGLHKIAWGLKINMPRVAEDTVS